jgi:hypothetical protein
MELNGTLRRMVYDGDVNLLGEIVNIKRKHGSSFRD